ncbi:MAG: DeoR/GlpR family DNA-binding transcription regulator [Treponema sp.]|jgi:DeoR/GlpR family transcriptional regulator of sugar metabolism|nr:DeoR/GlpR family DNA-binding transcription regulator [Treponema sp.]
MLTLERQIFIREILHREKAVSINMLSERFATSTASIRRDLEKLEQQGLVKRTYGGAVLIEGINEDIPLVVREIEQKEAKQKIARCAARYISDQDTIFMDSSTTTKELTNFLGDKKALTVITNGVRAITDLSLLDSVEVYGISGKLRKPSLSFVGNQAETMVTTYWGGKLFFSCTGMWLSHGAMDYSDAEAEVRKKMMTVSQEIILLCDHTKFDRPAFYRICPFSQVHILITDQKLAPQWESLLQQSGVEIVYAD